MLILVASALASHGFAATDALHEDFYVGLAAATRGLRERMKVRGRVLPGAREALDALAQTPGVAQSLVTGNIRPIAHEKLSSFGLSGWLDFEIGGYGSDGGVRSMLVCLARERSETKYGKAFAAERVVVIGDTQHDIAGALACGVVAIGVATGRTTAEELTAAGAHVVLPSLTDTEAVLHAVLDEARPVRW